MIKQISQLFTSKPANDDMPLELHVKGILRAVKYKDMTVEAAAGSIFSAINEHEGKLLEAANTTIRFLQREMETHGRRIR